jgi:hypothetical protein
MPAAERAVNNTNFVLWCAVNSRPFSMARDAGHALYVGNMDPKYAAQTISDETIEKIVSAEEQKLRTVINEKLRAAKEEFAPNGEAFCCAQLDLTTTQNRSFVTFSVTFTATDWKVFRLALATKVLEGTHTAVDLEKFIKEVNVKCHIV